MGKTIYDCAVCGKRRMNTPSGSVCPDGHGRLFPKIPARELSRIERMEWIESLPTAHPMGDGFYRVDGAHGYWVKQAVRAIKTGQTFKDGLVAVVNLSAKPKVIKLVEATDA